MAERWQVKFWKMYEPDQRTEHFPEKAQAELFADTKQDEGYLCIVRHEDIPDVEQTLPRKMVRLIIDSMKEKFDG